MALLEDTEQVRRAGLVQDPLRLSLRFNLESTPQQTRAEVEAEAEVETAETAGARAEHSPGSRRGSLRATTVPFSNSVDVDEFMCNGKRRIFHIYTYMMINYLQISVIYTYTPAGPSLRRLAILILCHIDLAIV